MMRFSRHCGVTPSPDIGSPYKFWDPPTLTPQRAAGVSTFPVYPGTMGVSIQKLSFGWFWGTPISGNAHIYIYMNIESYIYIQYSVYIHIYIYIMLIYIYTCICSSGTSYHLHHNFSRISIQTGWSPPRWWEMWPSSPCRRRNPWRVDVYPLVMSK